MNFFKLYIGDYQRDTAHLSIAEHGAYLLMIQHYCATEKPLPTGKALYRMLRAQSKIEHDAIDAVAAEFWRLSGDGLVNDRAAVEIEKSHAQAEANRRVAEAREEKKRATKCKRTEHESFNDPPKEPSTNRSTIDQPNHSHSQIRAKARDESANADLSPALLDAHPASVDSPPKQAAPACPHEAIIAVYHDALPELPAVRVWTDQRRKHLQARWRESPERQSVAWWRAFFGYVRGCPWLMGDGQPSPGRQVFRADLGWLLRPENFAKVIEGRYQRQEAT